LKTKKEFLPQKRLAKFCKKNNITYIDLAPIFSKHNPLPYSFPDPVHSNQPGHQIMAEAILQWMEENLGLKTIPASKLPR